MSTYSYQFGTGGCAQKAELFFLLQKTYTVLCDINKVIQADDSVLSLPRSSLFPMRMVVYEILATETLLNVHTIKYGIIYDS